MQEEEDTIVSRHLFFRARWAHLTGDLIIWSMDEAGSRESRMHGNSMAAQTTCPDLSCSRSCLLAAAAARNPQAICTTKNRERRATKIFTSHRRPDFTIAARRDDRRETRRGEESIADTWRARARARKIREHSRVETRATTSESILTEAAACRRADAHAHHDATPYNRALCWTLRKVNSEMHRYVSSRTRLAETGCHSDLRDHFLSANFD